MKIDHLILNVNDVEASVAFYEEVLGFRNEGPDGPFTTMRVDDDFIMQLAPWGSKGNEHYAFCLDKEEFESCFGRIRERGIAYGASFHEVGTNTGPGREMGARGNAPTIYFNDPNNNLIEIRTYDEAES